MITETSNEATTVVELPDIIPGLVPFIVSRIQRYHELFDQPLIAEFWEETLHKSFLEYGYSTTWKPDRSHKIGEDMRIENITCSRISCKS